MYAFLIADPKQADILCQSLGLAGFLTFFGIKLSLLVRCPKMQAIMSHLHPLLPERTFLSCV
jgi:hypothetical protein